MAFYTDWKEKEWTEVWVGRIIEPKEEHTEVISTKTLCDVELNGDTLKPSAMSKLGASHGVNETEIEVNADVMPNIQSNIGPWRTKLVHYGVSPYFKDVLGSRDDSWKQI